MTQQAKCYLVGGAVRDRLLGLPVKDKDWLVVHSSPEQLLAQGFQQVGKDFPVFLHPVTKQEYALARTERKSGRGYTGFCCDFSPEITLEQDLIRRDLTINAIAEDEQGNLHDPYNGLLDLEKRVLRHISTAFVEDPLRVLRVARFAARFHYLGFSIAEETLNLMTAMVEAGELKYLTAERVWRETERALLTQNPEVYFATLRQIGALAQLFPEIDRLFGVPNPAKYHPEIDSGVHTLLVLQQATLLTQQHSDLEKGVLRFAALCHDLGKGLTPKENYPHHYGHEKLGIEPINQLANRLKIAKLYQEVALLVAEYHSHLHRAFDLRAKTIIKLFNQLDLFRKAERLEYLCLVCQADTRGRLGFAESTYPQADYIKQLFLLAKAVDVQQIIAAGYRNQEIKEQLERQRIKQIEPLVKAQKQARKITQSLEC